MTPHVKWLLHGLVKADNMMSEKQRWILAGKNFVVYFSVALLALYVIGILVR